MSFAIAEEQEKTEEVKSIPIHLKLNLTIREAAEYSNIGINKIAELGPGSW